ncbi:uncharacterized protein LOC119798881 [Cyprinodon tularosa]|uniref:uncharacterized protein LOC119785656 n=1 Tax=Cyprinodon tularosa TaxID=77115 RepID=UPI0018E27E7C|nr:uncharacterized protein LOC119785656 [Cyprinodon tularosa]XP_038147558.1 uncharacterized protein LOC119787651 [Cyprinodon tularosa]XP_038155790.1 uncharacterized protein LOC119792978 [Cyprinodon tularosa]XP_038157501.1 uncharacterized protein LOC119794162 [Cyprinodon tularosa]XP_038164470.1 uncharacterized protein LOC119798881 [Cyprinodon tularosa]
MGPDARFRERYLKESKGGHVLLFLWTKSRNNSSFLFFMWEECADLGTSSRHCLSVASHMYGSSTANQRIESWGSYFRKQRSQFWMDLMNDLKERHLFNGSHEHTCLVRFVFMDMLQRDLDECKNRWHKHTIRPVKQSCCPSGKPDVMYHLPHRFGGTDCGFLVSQEPFGQFVTETNNIQCGDEHLQAHFENLQRQCGLAHPQSWESCVENYIKLKNMVDL